MKAVFNKITIDPQLPENGRPITDSIYALLSSEILS